MSLPDGSVLPADTPVRPSDRPSVHPSDRPARRSWRPLLLRLHFYAGVLVGPFLLVAAVSGTLYAVATPLERVVYADELTTDSRGEALPLDAQVAAARGEVADLPLLAVRPAAEEGATTRILFDDGDTERSRRLAVFVDPVTGEVRGSLTAYGTSGALPLRTWIDELHRNLHLGEPGRLYSELAASWLAVVALAGAGLWATRPRRVGSGRRRGRARTRALHGTLGIVAALGMLALAATGLTWSRYAGASITDLRTALDWNAPAVAAEVPGGAGPGTGHEGHEGHEGHGAPGDAADNGLIDGPGVGYQAAYDAAAAQGADGLVEVVQPTTATGTYVVTEVDRSYPTRADAFAVAPEDGEVVDVVRFADHPFMAKLARWGVDLHMGVLFGAVNQAALVALGLTITVLVLSGYRMWWQRRPTRGAVPWWRPGRPAARGAWRSAPPAGLAVLGVVSLVVGWFLPVLGVSLAAFLLVDALLGVRARRRTTA